ncbi:MAG: EAL domain-containing protein [Thermodesulfobacteriota bacterium]
MNNKPPEQGNLLTRENPARGGDAFKELAESRRTVMALLDASLDSAFLMDRDGVILAVNEHGARKMGGVSAREMTGRNMSEFIPAALFESRMEGVRKVFDTGSPMRFEDTRAGFIFDNNLVPVFGGGGEVARVAIFAKDVTELRKNERQLRRRAFQQGVVAELGVLALGSMDERDLTDRTCRMLAALFEVEFSEILELNDTQDQFLLVAGFGWNPGVVGSASVETAGTQSGLALVSQTPVVVEDLEQDRRVPDKAVLLKHGIKSGMSVLIHGRDKPYGVLGIHSTRPRAFEPDETQTLQSVANVISEAMERFKAVKTLEKLNERNSAVLNSVAQGIFGVDVRGLVTFANPAVEALTGFSQGDLVGSHSHWLLHHTRPDGAVYPEEECPLTRTLADGRHRHVEEDVYWRKDGSSFPVDFTCTPLFNGSKLDGAVVVFEDITGRRQAEERLKRLAFYDELTGLPNRAHFRSRLDQAMAQEGPGSRFAVLFVDLDDFKVVNDGLGHNLGDRLLCSIGARLKAALGPGRFLARMGGDEFAVLMEGEAASGAALDAAMAVHAVLAAPETMEGYEIVISGSVGIVRDDGRYADAEEVLRDADTAMFKAKSLGKGENAVFDKAMHAEVRSRLIMENDLRKALERGEFFLVYQPIVNLRGGALSGFEALLRWRHPEKGLISPLDFIPSAEATGLILPLGEWVLMEACSQMAAWMDTLPGARGLAMSVNLSGRQFMQRDLPGAVARVIEASGLNPSGVKLEITESVIMEHAGRTVEMLRELKSTGVSLMIDDFGTGYSSLAYLRRFPVDALKVDRAFVRNVDKDRGNLQIVRAVIELARSMEMDVVGEGIETEGELLALGNLGCGYGQGYHFAKPMGAGEAREYLRARLG